MGYTLSPRLREWYEVHLWRLAMGKFSRQQLLRWRALGKASRREMLLACREELERLPDERLRELLVQRYGLEDGRIRTQREVAQGLGISPARVSQLEWRAWHLLARVVDGLPTYSGAELAALIAQREPPLTFPLLCYASSCYRRGETVHEVTVDAAGRVHGGCATSRSRVRSVVSRWPELFLWESIDGRRAVVPYGVIKTYFVRLVVGLPPWYAAPYRPGMVIHVLGQAWMRSADGQAESRCRVALYLTKEEHEAHLRNELRLGIDEIQRRLLVAVDGRLFLPISKVGAAEDAGV